MPFSSAWPLAASPAAPIALGPRTSISLLGGGFAVIGLIVLAVMGAMAVSQSRFRSRALRTTGTIVARERASSRDYSDSRPTYYSIVEFTMEDGSLIRGRSRVASNPPAGKIGALVPLFYDPDDPSRVALDNGRTRTMNGCAVAVGIVIAAVFLLFGAVTLTLALHS